jgi:hypothetical protein
MQLSFLQIGWGIIASDTDNVWRIMLALVLLYAISDKFALFAHHN